MLVLLSQAAAWQRPDVDFFALAPELVLTAVAVLVLLADLFLEGRKEQITTFASVGVALTLIPIIALAVDNKDRVMFGSGYVVDDFALAMKALFVIAAYVTLLMSVNELSEGDYYEGEFSFLLLCSVLGMMVMGSARDLITIFVALETLSLPGYMLAGWRKRDVKSNEAALKYYLLGVVASAVMLYGMSFVYGVTGQTELSAIGARLAEGTLPANEKSLAAVGIFLIVTGFAFKVSAVPFHQWAPDTYEGAPTPVTAFLSVASKAAGFVALLSLVFVAFPARSDFWQPVFWILAVLTMTVGNLIALRQTNIVRMLAYSSVAQAGFILVPFAVAGTTKRIAVADQLHGLLGSSFAAITIYLVMYAAMNLGAFACVIAIARRTSNGNISSFGGLFEYSPTLAILMTVFLASLAGIPPLAGFWAKLFVFKSVLDAGDSWAIALAVITAINSVIAFGYYGKVMREMWMSPVAVDDRRTIRVPAPLVAGLALCIVGTVVLGILPGIVTRLGEFDSLFG